MGAGEESAQPVSYRKHSQSSFAVGCLRKSQRPAMCAICARSFIIYNTHKQEVHILQANRQGGNWMSAEENKALIRRFFDEVWNQGKTELAGEFIADSCQ